MADATGLAQKSLGNARAAAEAFERAIALDPSLASAWFDLGTAYLDLGEPQKAVATLHRFVAANPASGEGRFRYGEMLLVAGDRAGGLRELTDAARLGSTKARARLAEMGVR